jgi:glycosyltransferase involved in cell wall biosynthesis
MKIVFFHSSAEFYGSDQSLLSLAIAAKACKAELLVYLPKDSVCGSLCSKLESEGISHRHIAMGVARRRELKQKPLRHLARLALDVFYLVFCYNQLHNAPATVLVNTSAAIGPVVAHLIRRVLGRPVGKIHWVVREVLPKKGPLAVLYRVLAGRVDNIYGTSRDIANGVQKVTRRSRVYIAHPGARLGKPEIPKSRLDGELRLLHVGRIGSWKGQELLISSASALVEHYPRLSIEFIGSTYPEGRSVTQELKDLVREEGMSQHVRWLGQVDDPFAAYARSDLVIAVTTKPEPFGRAIVEAMSIGRCVVAVAAGGPIDIITHGVDGWLIDAPETRQLQQAILHLAQEENLLTLISANAQVRAAIFGEEANSRRLIQHIAQS